MRLRDLVPSLVGFALGGIGLQAYAQTNNVMGGAASSNETVPKVTLVARHREGSREIPAFFALDQDPLVILAYKVITTRYEKRWDEEIPDGLDDNDEPVHYIRHHVENIDYHCTLKPDLSEPTSEHSYDFVHTFTDEKDGSTWSIGMRRALNGGAAW